jgi:pimeloyl-ACP methyl ester carboxylesterase
MRVASSEGTEVALRVFEGRGPSVVLVHGWMMSGKVWDPMIELMQARGVRVVALDLRGCGESSRPSGRYSLDSFADDVVAAVEAAGGERPLLVGHSMGGQLAQLAAARLGARLGGLALLNSVPLGGLPLPPDAAGLFRSAPGSREVMSTILGLACTALSDAERTRLLDVAAGVEDRCVAEALEAWMAGSDASLAATIGAPTLVVATDDPFLPPAFLQQAVADPIARAALVHLPGCGHYPAAERPAETAATLLAFRAGLG